MMTGVLGEPTGTKSAILDEANRGVAQREQAAADGGQFVASYDNEDLKVTLHGDAAVTSYRFVVTIKGGNVDVRRRYRTTNVWANRQGRWQIVAAHTAFVLDPKQAATLAGNPLTESIRHGDETIARAHVLLDECEQGLGDGPRLAIANRLRVPLDDRRDLDRAAEEQHLA